MNKPEAKYNVEFYFPDTRTIEPGNWSEHGIIMQVNPKCTIEIGLYREPEGDSEYQSPYTIQVFYNDDVIVCESVNNL